MEEALALARLLHFVFAAAVEAPEIPGGLGIIGETGVAVLADIEDDRGNGPGEIRGGGELVEIAGRELGAERLLDLLGCFGEDVVLVEERRDLVHDGLLLGRVERRRLGFLGQ